MIDKNGSVWSEKMVQRHIRHLMVYWKLRHMDAWRFLRDTYGLTSLPTPADV